MLEYTQKYRPKRIIKTPLQTYPAGHKHRAPKMGALNNQLTANSRLSILVGRNAFYWYQIFTLASVVVKT